MTHQLTLESSIAAGMAGMAISMEAAVRRDPEFAAKAQAALIDYLKQQPQQKAAGEDITEAVCQAIGCTGRQLGATYKRLREAGLLRITRTDLPRRYGHGSLGGKEYELAGVA